MTAINTRGHTFEESNYLKIKEVVESVTMAATAYNLDDAVRGLRDNTVETIE